MDRQGEAAEEVSVLFPSRLEQMTNYSHSYISRYQSCPLACYYHNELKLRKREEGGESHHMAFSKAGHEGLRHLYANSYWTKTNGELKALLRQSQDLFLVNYPRQLNVSDLAKTRQGGVTALAQYIQRWKEEDRRYRVLSVEELDNAEDGFVVKLDLVVQDIATEQIFGMDHKITGKYLNYDYWAGYEPNSQIVEYVRFIKERHGYCDGFIVNALALRYLQRASKNGPAGLWCAFERQMFNVNGRQMEADLASRQYWTERIEHSKASGIWGMNTSQCKFCEYRDLCKAGWFYPEDAELIDVNYRQICGKWFALNESAPLTPCQLDRGHEGEHSPESPETAPLDIEIEIEV